MDIILVSQKLARARTITVSLPQLVLVTAAGIVAMLAVSGLLSLALVRYAAEARLPVVSNILIALQHDETQRRDSYLRDNLNAMAKRVGEMQAELLRLDTLGERLAK